VKPESADLLVRSVVDRGGDPLVDVIIPTRNRFELTCEAVRSVQQQTFSSWKLFVVDDASDDGSVGMVAKLADADPRIEVIRRERRGGAQAARQDALNRSTARYVAILDSDDVWAPSKLAKQIERFEARSGHLFDLGVVLCGHRWIREDGTLEGEPRIHAAEGRVSPLLSNNLSSPLLSRTTLDRVGGFLPEGMRSLRTCDSTELYLRLFREVEVSAVPEALVDCRHHPSSERASSALGTPLAAEELAYVFDRHEEWLREYPKEHARLRAMVGLRYLAVGRRRAGLSFFIPSLWGAGFRSALGLLRKYGPYVAKAVVVGH
jgi:glycosyltransferase involved in cell wall biosynthesis